MAPKKNKNIVTDDDLKDYSEEDQIKDMKLHSEQSYASECFDVDDFPRLSLLMCGMLAPVPQANKDKDVRKCAKYAITEYNKSNEPKLKLVKVLKATSSLVAGIIYYITFKAKDENGDVKTYQSEVFYGIPEMIRRGVYVDNIEVEKFRLKVDSQPKIHEARGAECCGESKNVEAPDPEPKHLESEEQHSMAPDQTLT